MELSADLFEKMLRQLKGDREADAEERRSAPRPGVRCRVHLQPVDKGHLGNTLDVWTRDISATGLGVMSSKRLKVGQHYLLTLSREDPDEHERLVLYCTVSHCRELADGLFGVGLAYTALDRTKKGTPAALPPPQPVASLSQASPALAQSNAVSANDADRIRNAILS